MKKPVIAIYARKGNELIKESTVDNQVEICKKRQQVIWDLEKSKLILWNIVI